MSDETNIGVVNLSGISDNHIQTGDITANITFGGDVIGQGKIVNFDIAW